MKYVILALFATLCSSLSAQPKKVEFQPSSFYRQFSHKTSPVLRLNPGDTLISKSVDSSGHDENNNKVAERGNPLVGPFYIEEAMPGDVLAVTITQVQVNRNTARTVETLVKRSLPMDVIKPIFARNAKLSVWGLDLEDNIGSPPSQFTGLDGLKIPLEPFMGCVGVAAPLKNKEPLSYFAGVYGGNMDFKMVTAGATIYLPVFHPGALLYVGDGHAAQGDGELTGDALEVSMNFGLSTRVIKDGAKGQTYPRIENSDYLMCLATDKKMDEALKKATLEMTNWLMAEYKFTLGEVSQILGPALEYRIPSLAGPEYIIVTMIPKSIMKSLIRQSN